MPANRTTEPNERPRGRRSGAPPQTFRRPRTPYPNLTANEYAMLDEQAAAAHAYMPYEGAQNVMARTREVWNDLLAEANRQQVDDVIREQREIESLNNGLVHADADDRRRILEHLVAPLADPGTIDRYAQRVHRDVNQFWETFDEAAYLMREIVEQQRRLQRHLQVRRHTVRTLMRQNQTALYYAWYDGAYQWLRDFIEMEPEEPATINDDIASVSSTAVSDIGGLDAEDESNIWRETDNFSTATPSEAGSSSSSSSADTAYFFEPLPF